MENEDDETDQSKPYSIYYDSSTVHHKLNPDCPVCLKPVFWSRHILSLDRVWHLQCYICSYCFKVSFFRTFFLLNFFSCYMTKTLFDCTRVFELLLFLKTLELNLIDHVHTRIQTCSSKQQKKLIQIQ